MPRSKKISSRPSSSTSALNDAMMGAINMVRNRPEDRKRIIIMISKIRRLSNWKCASR